ncbi:MAG: replication factor C large subunit [Candidatus Woesearchaeota archaeon]
MHWVIKYKPNTLADVVGHKEEIALLKNFVKNFRQQKKKAVILTGPCGSGKTSIVYALANDMHLEIIEINASDVRNKEHIVQVIGSASKQRSLFAEGKIILVDEIDGLSGTEDRGGAAALAEILSKTCFPIIMTAQEIEDEKIKPLKKDSLCIQLKELSYQDVYSCLKKICERECIKYDDYALKMLARRSGSDLRAAINDLQSLAQDKTLQAEDLASLADRERTSKMHDALIKILKPVSPDIALGALDCIDEELDEIILWLDENIPKEYTKPADLVRAYDVLSQADVFRGRINRKQHWRFLSYINNLITAGVASAKDQKYTSPANYVPPKRILKIWIANQRFLKKKNIALKIAENTHTSFRRAIKDTFPYIHFMFKHSRGSENDIASYLELNTDEIDLLLAK